MSIKFVETAPIALLSPLSGSATSATITPYPVDLDGVKLTMTDFGTLPTFTIDPKISGYEEINSFTGITDNGDNTATLTGLTRNLLGKSPYTASPSGGKLHGSGGIIVFSDNPQVYARLAALENANTWSAIQTFSVSPIVPTGGTGTQAANATDIANAIVGASGTATNTVFGTVKLSVAAVSGPAPIAVGDNDTRVPPVNTSTMTAGQVAALAGESGTAPSVSNKFEDYADTAAVATATKLVRANALGKVDQSFIPTMNFGTGADGAVVISVNTTLTRDWNYTNLTINNNVTLTPNGFRIFVSGTLTFLGTGVIAANGGNASGATAGTAANTAGTLPASYAGATGGAGGTSGGSGSAGEIGVSKTNSIGVSGVAGGTATGAAAGTAGTATAAQNNPGLMTLYAITMGDYNGAFTLDATSGAGGGSASTGGTNGVAGGGSGAPGGIIFVFAQNIVTVNSNTYISANGGTGANGSGGGSAGTSYSGGGGGGSGGIVILGYISKTGTGVISVAGGTAGNAGGSGATGGTNGLTGVSYVITA